MKILSSKMGSWSLATSLLIKTVLYIITYYYCYCKNYYRERGRTKVESILRKPVYATSNSSSFLLCVNKLFNRIIWLNDNHIQTLRLHIRIFFIIHLHNTTRFVGKNVTAVNAECQENFLACHRFTVSLSYYYTFKFLLLQCSRTKKCSHRSVGS
jgi:hypothetical protein